MKESSIRVILLEDDDDDAYLIKKSLSDEGNRHYSVDRLHQLSDYYDSLSRQTSDVLLLDLNLAESKGLNTLRAINIRCPNHPVIVLTNCSDGEYGQESIHLGADDFLNKAEINPSTLGRAIRYAIERFKLKSQLEQNAFTDELTGLPNRALLRKHLNQCVAAAKRKDAQLAVAMIDLNRFKVINDTHGHLWGDELLKSLGERLSNASRHADIIARFGGDEFICLYSKFDGAESIEKVLERKLSELQKPVLATINAEEKTLSVGACAGVALFPGDGQNAEELILAADKAMYLAKQLPDGSVVFNADSEQQTAG